MTLKQILGGTLLIILLVGCTANDHTNTMKESEQIPETKPPSFDWQGHRGARGLVPENTIPSFLKALEFDSIKTLELDVVVSKDQKIIISHEPWFSHHICTKPDGSPITEEEALTLRTYEMTAAEIQTYDCGSKGNERFPDQAAMAVVKPTLTDMVKQIEQHCTEKKLPLPYYNIELKSHPDYYNVLNPAPAEFVGILLGEINSLGVHDRVNLQSFDFNILRKIRQQDPDISMAMLIENLKGVEANVATLGFTPPIYSPYYQLLNDTVVQEIHDKGMRVIPWTVNTTEEMKNLIDMGVDGIITDYPNRIPH